MKLSVLQKLFIVSLVILTSLVITVSCKKLDSDIRKKPFVDKAKEFLTVPASTSPTVKRIAETIKKQNEQTHFLDWFADKFGYAIWEKSPIYYQKGNANGRINSGSIDTVAFVPLVRKGVDQVYSFLACAIGQDSVQIRLLRGDQYGAYGKSFRFDTLSSEMVALQCMVLEYTLFGHDSYRVNDLGLFKRSPAGTNNESRFFYIKEIDDSKENGARTSDYLPIFSTYCVTWSVDGDQGQVVGSDPGETPDYSYSGEDCFDVVTWVPIIQGGPNATTPSEGSQGGGGSWYNEDVCREVIPGDCGTENQSGWVGIDNGESNYNNYLNWGYWHFDTWYVTPDDYANIQYWRENNIDTTGLDSCRRLILRKLLNDVSNNNFLGKTLAKMERSIFETTNLEKLIWRFHIKNLAGTGSVANTDTIIHVGTTFTAITVLDSTISHNATDIYVAATMLHELIHAYMVTTMLRVKQGATLANLKAMTYDSLFNEYIDTLTARNAPVLTSQSFPQEYQHNYMQTKLLNAMAEALKQFDGNRINNDEYYWYLTWKGLFKTDAWKQHWPNYYDSVPWPIVGAPYTTNDSTRGMKYALTPTRLLNINTAITAEKLANSSALGNKPISGGCY